MWNKKTFLLAGVVLILISTANADLILTLNGVDAARELADTEGKEKLIIAVGGDSEVDPNAYHIEAAGGVLQDNGGGEYSLTFEDNSSLCIVSLIADNDMIIDGVSIEEGDTIYELSLFYISETNTVTVFGVDFEGLSSIRAEVSTALTAGPEPQTAVELGLESEAEAQPEPKPVPEPRTEIFPPSSKRRPIRRTEGINKLRYFPETNEDLSFRNWVDAYADFLTESQSYGTELPDGFDGSGGGMLTEGEGDYIEIPAGTVITENTVWDCNVHLLGCVEVNNAMLIIEPGVEVRITNYNYGIEVRNNGCVIANGTPDNMINFIPTYWEHPYLAYGFAILLEETASPLCEVSYCRIFYADVGIAIHNKRLENPIHDNIFRDCGVGIGQLGPMLTDVVNNTVYNLGYPESEQVEPAGIAVHLADACGVASNTAEIYIGNNTLTGWLTFGIWVSGVEDPNDAGTVTIANNLIAGSLNYAIYLINGYMRSLAICNGFYLNENEMNFDPDRVFENESSDSNTVAVIEDFNSYEEAADLRAVWNDHWRNGTGATVFVYQPSAYDMLVLDGNSMRYDYNNHIPEWGYYSEANATIGTGAGKLDIDPDWTSGDANTLTLFFYGQSNNDTGEQMYVKLTDGDEDEIDFYSIDNFNSYEQSSDLRAVWKDYWRNGSRAEVKIEDADPNIGGPPHKSMHYNYTNNSFPYYAKAEADVCDLPSEIGPDWFWLGAETLSLWFWGKVNNDANEQMYIELVDGDNPAHTAAVFYSDYGDMNDIRDPHWHQWNILLTDFADVNRANVSKIVIGFGDGATRGRGTVIFEDIRLYAEYPPPFHPPHSVKVLYDGGDYCLAEEWWHVWNIPFTELADVNLANVKSIAIGFGDGNEPYETTGAGEVYFEDVVLGNGNAENPFYDGSVYLEEDPFVFGFDYDSDPLFLKQGCPLIEAGAGYIDEYPYLLGKHSCVYKIADTNNLRGIPDTNMVNIGCHYRDWNNINDGSGSADLDYSNTADLKDFMILANSWLQETSGTADLDGSGFVDYLDLAMFAEGWQRTEAMYVEGYSFDTQQSLDLNSVSGDISIGPENIPPDAREVFVYVDDVQVASWERGISEWNGFLESDKFTNGQHTIRLVSVNLNDSVTNYKPMNAYFNNMLYKVLADEQFHPDENYRYSCFYDGEDSLEATLTGLYDNVLWSDTYSGDCIDINIPGSVFGTEKFCKISITEAGGAMMATMGEDGMAMASSSSDPVSKKDLTKKFKREDSSGAKMLIIMPDEDIFSLRLPALLACAQACQDRDVIWVPLYYRDVNEGNLTFLLTQDSVKYIYWAGHGESHIGGVQRTNTHCWNKLWPYWLRWWRWEEIRVFSQTGIEPPLPDDWDTKGVNLSTMSVGGIEMHDTWNKKIVFIDCCKSADFNDMAAAYGMWSLQGQGSKDQIYIGWRGNVSTAIWELSLESRDVTYGIRVFWEQMGNGKGLKEAFDATASDFGGEHPYTPINLWGVNGHPDYKSKEECDDNLLLLGLGLLKAEGLNYFKLQY